MIKLLVLLVVLALVAISTTVGSRRSNPRVVLAAPATDPPQLSRAPVRSTTNPVNMIKLLVLLVVLALVAISTTVAAPQYYLGYYGYGYPAAYYGAYYPHAYYYGR
uniref:Putative conserved plasma membrane protein n=1 Tax=Amblyomma triste TaxID=251400 RepID=A0A023G440_AMBTT